MYACTYAHKSTGAAGQGKRPQQPRTMAHWVRLQLSGHARFNEQGYYGLKVRFPSLFVCPTPQSLSSSPNTQHHQPPFSPISSLFPPITNPNHTNTGRDHPPAAGGPVLHRRPGRALLPADLAGDRQPHLGPFAFAAGWVVGVFDIDTDAKERASDAPILHVHA